MTTTSQPPTSQLLDALHAHYIRPEDRTSPAGAGAIFLTEVTAPDSTRRADAVHIGLWQSRGAGEIDVCELKTSRGDWRRELDHPAKAEAWWPYSTRFWVVAPHTSIVPPDEVPPGWGLMVPGTRGRRFKTIVKPAVREPQITVPLLMTLLKNTETTRTNALRQQHSDLVTQHYRELDKLRKDLRATADPDTKRRLAALDELEQALGITIGSRPWRGEVAPKLAGDAMARFLRDEAALATTKQRLDRDVRTLDATAELLTSAAADLRALTAPAAVSGSGAARADGGRS